MRTFRSVGESGHCLYLKLPSVFQFLESGCWIDEKIHTDTQYYLWTVRPNKSVPQAGPADISAGYTDLSQFYNLDFLCWGEDVRELCCANISGYKYRFNTISVTHGTSNSEQHSSVLCRHLPGLQATVACSAVQWSVRLLYLFHKQLSISLLKSICVGLYCSSTTCFINNSPFPRHWASFQKLFTEGAIDDLKLFLWCKFFIKCDLSFWHLHSKVWIRL